MLTVGHVMETSTAAYVHVMGPGNVTVIMYDLVANVSKVAERVPVLEKVKGEEAEGEIEKEVAEQPGEVAV